VKAPAYALAQEYFDRVDKIIAIFAALPCVRVTCEDWEPPTHVPLNQRRSACDEHD